jgi:hypothetical protein
MNVYEETKEKNYLFQGLLIPPDIENIDYQKMISDVKSGKAELIYYFDPVPTTAEKIAAIRDAVGLHIETVAKSAGDFGFDSVLSAVSYVGGESNNINVMYGTAIFNYRQECWNKSRELLAVWRKGGKELTPEQAVKKMPLWKDYKPEL